MSKLLYALVLFASAVAGLAVSVQAHSTGIYKSEAEAKQRATELSEEVAALAGAKDRLRVAKTIEKRNSRTGSIPKTPMIPTKMKTTVIICEAPSSSDGE